MKTGPHPADERAPFVQPKEPILTVNDQIPEPAVRISETDYRRLSALSAVPTEGGGLLARELDRARIVSDAQLAAEPDFVRLGSAVAYRDVLSGRVRKVQIAVPEHADIDRGRLSVLSPVGAALLGLAPGDRFSWTGDKGRARIIQVEQVEAAA